MPALIDLHSHIGYENTAANTEDERHFTRENVIDHLERFAYTGHALTHSLGNDNPALFDARYADDPAKFVDLRVESQQDSFTGARYYTIGRGLAWEGTGNPRNRTLAIRRACSVMPIRASAPTMRTVSPSSTSCETPRRTFRGIFKT